MSRNGNNGRKINRLPVTSPFLGIKIHLFKLFHPKKVFVKKKSTQLGFPRHKGVIFFLTNFFSGFKAHLVFATGLTSLGSWVDPNNQPKDPPKNTWGSGRGTATLARVGNGVLARPWLLGTSAVESGDKMIRWKTHTFFVAESEQFVVCCCMVFFSKHFEFCLCFGVISATIPNSTPRNFST